MTSAAFLADGFLADDECLACVWAMDAGVREESEVLGAGAESRQDFRRAETIEVERAVLSLVEERLDRYRDRVARHFGGGIRGVLGNLHRPAAKEIPQTEAKQEQGGQRE